LSGLRSELEDAPSAPRRSSTTAVAAGFLGWTLDAFDFFVLTFVVADVAKDFGTDAPHVALTISASLFTRFIGAIAFGLLADRFGRRLPLILNILYYSVIEVLSGLAPSYVAFLLLRLLYGVGMGGEWGVGASLTMESVPVRWRGIISGLLQEGYAFGNLLAAAAYFLVRPHFGPHWGWRVLFFIGGAPALLTLFVRARVQEPEAWRRSRVTWQTYRHVVVSNGRRFLYIIVFMAAMNMVSHGSQDMYPTFLQHDRGFSTAAKSGATALSMVGAICGGLFFGALSDRLGRRRAMIAAMALGLLIIPLWMFAPSMPSLLAGGFLMQFMVQGAWGVVPVHLNELSPDQLRGLFPGLAYQLGVLLAALSPFIETRAASQMGYATAMGSFAAIVLVFGIIVVAFGPESRGVVFGRGTDGT
jgi:MFS transporter, SHS family, lactate transporter